MIEDIVMSVAIFLFVPALIPALVTKSKPHRMTCLTTASLLSIITVCFGIKDLWIQFSAEFPAALAWWILLFQRREHE